MKNLKLVLATLLVATLGIAVSSFTVKSFNSRAFSVVCFKLNATLAVSSLNSGASSAIDIIDDSDNDGTPDVANWDPISVTESQIINTDCLGTGKVCAICFDDQNGTYSLQDAADALAAAFSATPRPTFATGNTYTPPGGAPTITFYEKQ